MNAILKQSKTTEQEILQRLRIPKTFEQGFALLVDTYAQAMYWSIRRMVFNHQDADDVLQNAFVKIYQGIKHFKGESKLYTWLYRIAMNESITFLHRQKRRKKILHTAFNDNKLKNNTESIFFDTNKADLCLQKALATLPEKQREVFNLRYFEEMSYADMAELLGKSAGGLKAGYHHAVKKIERYIRAQDWL